MMALEAYRLEAYHLEALEVLEVLEAVAFLVHPEAVDWEAFLAWTFLVHPEAVDWEAFLAWTFLVHLEAADWEALVALEVVPQGHLEVAQIVLYWPPLLSSCVSRLLRQSSRVYLATALNGQRYHICRRSANHQTNSKYGLLYTASRRPRGARGGQ
jgi:hypothetical protein